ncbi:uncharacterized protein LOC114755944 [Neltuma alba]|uniref:uncharacterized protein LOC114755944 n=1 Tax=Neltuma alba TaxID=207710 RepID=UPI0010A47A5E|nr:uncharacterized protein LOC114755944 [Prosopis alba]
MANLTKLEFTALDIIGKNYLSWVLDAEIHLDAKGLGSTILPGNEATSQDKAKAMIFLRHHLHEGLKAEYLTVTNPLELWNNLKERYDHQKTQQYREKGFKKYSELISCLLVAEQNNKLLMKNHEIRPTGSAPFPEANVTVRNNHHIRGCGRGRGRDRGRGRGRTNYRYYGRGSNSYNPNTHQKKKLGDGQKKDKNGPSRVVENQCYRCGMKGHWSHTCRTLEHLAKLYQASIKRSSNNVEANLTFQSDDVEANFAYKNDDINELDDVNGLDAMAHLDVADFFENHD